MIPQSGIGEEKSKLAQARLQKVCFFAAPFARRLYPSASLSVVPVLQDFQIIKINGQAIILKRFLSGICNH